MNNKSAFAQLLQHKYYAAKEMRIASFSVLNFSGLGGGKNINHLRGEQTVLHQNPS
jgi:hypothetical protein